MPQAIAHPKTRWELLLRKDNEAQFTPFYKANFAILFSLVGRRTKSEISVDFALFFRQNQSINIIVI